LEQPPRRRREELAVWSLSGSRPPFAGEPRELLLLGAGLLDRLHSREPKLSPPVTRDAWTPDFSGNGFALKLGGPLDWSQSNKPRRQEAGGRVGSEALED